ncbi:uncharacterized protein FIBRA_00296 [Fibroporia radiculosa]|uniref:Uncharacterized protein n=1 Tax=Fibroporia radiculosa TaxID=599839 RepID=J7RGU3_9APHY|nr:uncharacterized protein FIBRA_00296 [Fibroporia radiculosa]CCL98302.1 predicted protein [Fibroporia radiculosa]
MPRSVASLDSISLSSDNSYDIEEEERIAEQEWNESMAQLQQLVSFILLPILGRWLGRKWSYWAYARYLRFGLGKSFFLGEQR